MAWPYLPDMSSAAGSSRSRPIRLAVELAGSIGKQKQESLIYHMLMPKY
jgi:hypothetical protein